MEKITRDNEKIDFAISQIGLLIKKFGHDLKKPHANSAMLLDRIQGSQCDSLYVLEAIKGIYSALENNILTLNELLIFSDEEIPERDFVDLQSVINGLNLPYIEASFDHSKRVYANEIDIKKGIKYTIDGLFEFGATTLKIKTEEVTLNNFSYVLFKISITGDLLSGICEENLFYPFIEVKNKIILNFKLATGYKLMRKNYGKLTAFFSPDRRIIEIYLPTQETI